MRTRNAGYKRLMQQVVVVQSDEEGSILRTLIVFTDISSIKTNTAMSLSILGLCGEPSYHNILSSNTRIKINNPLSKRELQVLQLVSEGKSSKQIALVFSLSEHTIKNHRKNMLRKANVQSSTALIAMAMANSWAI